MYVERQNYHRKIFPSNHKNNGIIHRAPLAPPTRIETLIKQSIIVITNKNIYSDKPCKISISKIDIKHNRMARAFNITPLTKVCLTPIFRISVGGGRIGGGGTSKESIRRAKRKVKKNNYNTD